MNTPFSDRETEAAVVRDYKLGRKLRQIEEDHNLTRSVVYRILRSNAVAPQRVKQKSRDEVGDTEATLSMLYELVEQQDQRIQELEKLLGDTEH